MVVPISVFEVGGQRYGVKLDSVVEYARLPALVKLPKAPPVVEGVANIRGLVVPVLDIRMRFGLAAKPLHPSDYLVVARAGSRVAALRVDRVHGTEEIDSAQIEDARTITPAAEYLAGVAKLRDGLVLIHDFETFLTVAEAAEVDRALAAANEEAE